MGWEHGNASDAGFFAQKHAPKENGPVFLRAAFVKNEG